jgi:hypothetical protein
MSMAVTVCRLDIAAATVVLAPAAALAWPLLLRLLLRLVALLLPLPASSRRDGDGGRILPLDCLID